MERTLLILSTLCYLAAVVRTVLSLRRGQFQPGLFNFTAIGAGFLLQTAFLFLRGHALGHCPLTNLFEVFIFLAWSVALIYLLVGPAYRLSLMGAFTSPLVFLIQFLALLAPIDQRHAPPPTVNSWLELHASVSLISYGAFALACVAGLMYLVQERQLKTHQIHSVFYFLPPLMHLFAAMTRLLWVGFLLYTVGMITGFFTGEPLPQVKMAIAFSVWVLYAIILAARHLRRLAPKSVAALCVFAFSAALTLLWGITFVSQSRPL